MIPVHTISSYGDCVNLDGLLMMGLLLSVRFECKSSLYLSFTVRDTAEATG